MLDPSHKNTKRWGTVQLLVHHRTLVAHLTGINRCWIHHTDSREKGGKLCSCLYSIGPWLSILILMQRTRCWIHHMNTLLMETSDTAWKAQYLGCMSHLCWIHHTETTERGSSMTAQDPNSKHWFTTSFLQPLHHLITPYVSENCQLTLFRWCSNGTKFATDNSNYIRHFFHNYPCCLRQHN